MGLKSAAFICQRLTNAVNWIYSQEGFSAVYYLDDFGAAEIWENLIMPLKSKVIF